MKPGGPHRPPRETARVLAQGPVGRTAAGGAARRDRARGAFFVQVLIDQRMLFASLASSAFLIYRSPLHPMNGVRRMVLTHGRATGAGVGAALLLGAGYRAAAVAMIVTAVVLVGLDLMGPPRAPHHARLRVLRPARAGGRGVLSGAGARCRAGGPAATRDLDAPTDRPWIGGG
jgi:hypothetical protein